MPVSHRIIRVIAAGRNIHSLADLWKNEPSWMLSIMSERR